MWDINTNYQFNLINSLQNIIGTQFTGELQAIVNYTQVLNYGSVNTFFSQMSFLVPNAPKLEDLQYLVFRLNTTLPNGSNLLVIPECFIKLNTVQQTSTITLNFKITSLKPTDIALINALLKETGYNDFQITKIEG